MFPGQWCPPPERIWDLYPNGIGGTIRQSALRGDLLADPCGDDGVGAQREVPGVAFVGADRYEHDRAGVEAGGDIGPGQLIEAVGGHQCSLTSAVSKEM